MSRRQRQDYPRLERIDTRWSDEDVYGHVNNVTYYSYFDTAVNRFLITASGHDVRRLGAWGVVAETGCVFHRELRFPEPVEVGIAVTRLGTSSVVYELAIFQGPAPEPAAVGRFVHVYVDATTRQVTPVPEVLRSVLRAVTVES